MQFRVKESKCADVCAKRSHSEYSSCVLSVDFVVFFLKLCLIYKKNIDIQWEYSGIRGMWIEKLRISGLGRT